MASNAPGKCCIKATLHDGTPAGSTEKLGGIDCYLTGDKTSKKAVLMLTDVFGLELKNNLLVADAMAQAGYFVVIPDLFYGEPLSFPPPENADFPGFLSKHNPERVTKITEDVLAALKKEYNPEFIASTGYCFGAKYVARLIADSSKVQAGGMAHPSFVDEEEVKAIKSPVFIAAAETDQIYPEEKRHLTEKILKENGTTYFMTLSSGVEHGYAVKGDISIPQVKYAKEKCALDFAGFFDHVYENKLYA